MKPRRRRRPLFWQQEPAASFGGSRKADLRSPHTGASAACPLSTIVDNESQRAESHVMFDWSDLTLLLPWKVQLGCLVLLLVGGALVFMLIR